MKILILILLSLTAQASNWMPVSGIQSQSKAGYQLESECIKRTQEQCLDVGDAPDIIEFSQLENHYAKSNTVACESDCEDEFSELVCDDESFEKIKNIDLSQVYCTKLLGKKLVKNEQAYADHVNQVAQQNAAINMVKKMRQSGDDVINLMILRNAQKQLNPAQRKQILSQYNEIKNLLDIGNLAQAKIEIESAQVSEIVTQQDKDALVARINSYLE